MGTSNTGIRRVLLRLENIFPGRRPPVVFESKAELTVLRPRDRFVPAPPSGTIPATGVSLNLMTYNVWGLQGPLGVRQKERMSQIGPAVRFHDVVAMQETFSRHSGLVGRLADYTYQLKGSDGGLLRGGSGLTMLTSHAILAKDFVPFKQAAGADRISQKGVLFMRIQVAGTGPVDIYNTHLAAGGPEFKDHNVDTVVQMVKRNDRGYPTFIMGDLNLTPDEAPFRRMVQLLDLRDAYAERHPGQTGATASPQNTNHQPTDPAERIDYILVRRNDRFDIAITSAEVGMTETIKGQHPSDHFAVIGQFQITPKVSRPSKQLSLAAARMVLGGGAAHR